MKKPFRNVGYDQVEPDLSRPAAQDPHGGMIWCKPNPTFMINSGHELLYIDIQDQPR
jgi:hypothetical protein